MSDLAPNDGSFFIPAKDSEEQEKINNEKAETVQALPFIAKTVEWFDMQAQEAEKLTNIDLKHPTLTGEQQIAVYQEISRLLILKKGEYQTYISAYRR